MLLKLSTLFVASLISLNTFAQQQIEGRVFVDENQNSAYDSGEQLLSGILVSNGKDIVASNHAGVYKIKPLPGNPVFLIKPSQYISKAVSGRMQFYIGEDALAATNKHDFPLSPNPEKDALSIALLGDPQVDAMDDVFHVDKLVVEELAGKPLDFVVPLGDLSFDNHKIFAPLSQSLALIGAPIFYVMGNHDMDYHSQEITQRDWSFSNFFGPSYYAFEYGKQLFLILNNVYPKGEKEYAGKLDETQKAFIKNLLDLKKGQYPSINIFMHIPLEEMEDQEEVIRLFEGFENVFVATGHTHTQYQKYFARPGRNPVHELVAGAVCGAWWQGPHDLQGVPFALMADGTPKGYWFLNSTADDYQLTYKVSGAPASQQIQLTLPLQRDWDTALNVLNDDFIYANVFAATPETEVQISFDGIHWQPMEHHTGIDPQQKLLFEKQRLGRFDNANISKIPKPTQSSQHLWRFKIPASLPEGTHLIRVQAKDKKRGFDVSGAGVLRVGG